MKSKKVLAIMLAATMVMTSSLTVFAAGSGSAAPAAPVEAESGTSSESVSGSTSEGTSAGTGDKITESTSDSSSQSTSSAVETAAATIQKAGAVISVAGSAVKTSIAGAYAAKTVQGVVVMDSLTSIKANLGLKGSQTPYIMVFDTDVKKSNMAMACVNAAVTAMGGGTVAATLNIDLGAKDNGKFVKLQSGTAGMMIGLPKGVDTTKEVKVVCVRPGGTVTILKDMDSNPKTVTFEVYAGLGTYAIVTQ